MILWGISVERSAFFEIYFIVKVGTCVPTTPIIIGHNNENDEHVFYFLDGFNVYLNVLRSLRFFIPLIFYKKLLYYNFEVYSFPLTDLWLLKIVVFRFGVCVCLVACNLYDCKYVFYWQVNKGNDFI